MNVGQPSQYEGALFVQTLCAIERLNVFHIYLTRLDFHVWHNEQHNEQQVQKGKDTSSMMAESFDCVTIFYGEIVGLDKLISDYNEADEVRGKGLRYLPHTMAIKSWKIKML